MKASKLRSKSDAELAALRKSAAVLSSAEKVSLEAELRRRAEQEVERLRRKGLVNQTAAKRPTRQRIALLVLATVILLVLWEVVSTCWDEILGR